MRQPGKRKQQHCLFWCTSENMMSTSYRPSTSSYNNKALFYFTLSFLAICLSSIRQCTYQYVVVYSHRVAFVWHSCVLRVNYLNRNAHLRVAFVCGSGAIVWPSVGIVLASAVDWLLTKFGAIFVRNSKFHIRMAIWCQFRDSVTPALSLKNRGPSLVLSQ